MAEVDPENGFHDFFNQFCENNAEVGQLNGCQTKSTLYLNHENLYLVNIGDIAGAGQLSGRALAS